MALLDDSELARAGLAAILAPLASRVDFVGHGVDEMATSPVDVLLFEPVGMSPADRAVVTGAGRSGARCIPYTWADPHGVVEQLGSGDDPIDSYRHGPRESRVVLPKTLTGPQLVDTIERIITGRDLSRSLTPDTRTGVGQDIFDHLERQQVTRLAAQRAVVHTEDAEAPHPTRINDVGLTERENDILELVARGLSNIEIGTELGLSINTVKTYVRSTYRKIGTTSRTRAVLWATSHGYGEADPQS
ncbi:response regulator transcription factor [Nocardioides sp. C4-1]|uniref:response regulator transcription factor n=1 Tax=Nocardioides sp. C4-1 TaxID=3151851 RepID=UPI00326394F1